MIKIKTPPRWRKGQTLFNFFEWLTTKGYAQNQSLRMADPFHIPDEALDKLYNAFLKEHTK